MPKLQEMHASLFRAFGEVSSYESGTRCLSSSSTDYLMMYLWYCCEPPVQLVALGMHVLYYVTGFWR